MRYAELEGDIVRHVGGGADYKILPPQAVEIAPDADVREGDVYENGEFRRKTTEELYEIYRPQFDQIRKQKFNSTQWIRERFADYREMHTQGQITNTVWGIVVNKYKEWLIYWKALRDMPQQPDFDPTNLQWPKQPE